MDLDRYYTPDNIASMVANSITDANPHVIVDAACGRGSLLVAAELRFPEAKCVAFDKDVAVVKTLRRRRPHWHVEAIDCLMPGFRERGASVARRVGVVDVVLANPPFSMGARKGVVLDQVGDPLRCSVAMAHILTNLDVFRPRLGAIAIVPESLLYSRLDSDARRRLEDSVHVDALEPLSREVFLGAKANSVVVRLLPRLKSHPHELQPVGRSPLRCKIVRGGLPVHEATLAARGTPYAHSTDLHFLAAGGPTKRLARVRRLARGVVRGPALLIPRVGVPGPSIVRPSAFDSPIQLSDCVIAITGTPAIVKEVAETVRSRWASFQRLYTGTGARFVTVARLEGWLMRNGL